MENSINESAIKKLKLLVTIVDRTKGEFYLDVISQFEVNSQLLVNGKGTANSDLIELLELNINKAIILSFAREDQVDAIMDCLEEKFTTIKKGKGVSFAVPLSSVIGVNLYQYLSNNRQGRGA